MRHITKNQFEWIFFDWYLTLFNPLTGRLYDDVLDIFQYIKSKNIKIGIISLADTETADERSKAIERSEIAKFVHFIKITDQSKDVLYEEACGMYHIKPENLAIVDDNKQRGIYWGNKFGATTIWIRRGMFLNIFNISNIKPTLSINKISELREVL